MSANPTMQRLDDQIKWYDSRSATNQKWFKVLKVIVIASAALVAFVSALPHVPAWGPGALGVVIAIAEGLQQVNQYHANWIAYRSTCETLKHEKYLFLGNAGPYPRAGDPQALLAERIESLVSQEHAKWASGQELTEKARQHPAGKS